MNRSRLILLTLATLTLTACGGTVVSPCAHATCAPEPEAQVAFAPATIHVTRGAARVPNTNVVVRDEGRVARLRFSVPLGLHVDPGVLSVRGPASVPVTVTASPTTAPGAYTITAYVSVDANPAETARTLAVQVH